MAEARSVVPPDQRPSAPGESPSGSGSIFGVRDFRTFFIGQSVSMLASQFSMIAFPWLVLLLTGNGLAMGSVLALMGVPRALLMLVGGAVTDRFSCRGVLLASTVGRFAVISLLAALTLGGLITAPVLYFFALAFGIIDAFSFPAGSAILPQLVGSERLGQANALVQGTAQIAVFVGPVVASAVIAALSGGASAETATSMLGIGVAFVVDACGFAVSAIALASIRTRAVVAQQAGESVLRAIREGLTTVWHDAPVRVYFIMIAGINLLFAGPFAIGIPVLARMRLVEGVTALGMIMSAYGGGSLLGIVLAGSLKVPFERQTGRVTGLISTLGLGLVVIGLSFSTPLTALVAATMGFANGYVVVGFITWLQRRTPPQMLGRVMSLLMFASVGLQPVSMTLGGALVDLNATALFVGAGVLLTALVLAMGANPALRGMGIENAAAEAGRPAEVTALEEAVA